MKTRLATCFCLLSLVFSCKKSNFQKRSVTIGNISISNPKPERGQELTIYYTSENREFLDDQFAAYYYILVGNTIYQEDLEMEDSDENKKAEIHIPDSATAIAFNFKNGDNYDINNNSGYVFELYNEDKPVPGALAAKSFRAAQFYHSLAMIKLESEEVDDAVVFSERAIKALKEGNPEGKPKLLNQNQLHDDIEEDIREARYIYASALYKKGALPEAINELEKIIGAGEIPVLNERYVQFLIENENYEKAEQKAKKFIVSGKATEALRSNFKKAYQQNHAIDDVEDKLAALEEEGYEKLKEEFASKMMDKEMPELQLNDSNGNSIHLKDLKGKTVVLDFWSTHCQPCIEAFPKMERIMSHFEEDKDVLFYYVNTLQSGDEKERHNLVEEFMTKHGFSLDVLYDQVKDNRFITSANFQIPGLPTRIFIGPDGKWKFTEFGYSDDYNQLFRETKIMIELTKA